MAAVNATTAASTLGVSLIELVQARVSQIHGCALCMDMHTSNLRKQGETWQRIHSLSTWREMGFYSERERAALNWAELLTRRAADHSDNDAAFSALKSLFSVQEIVDLSWAIAQINAWIRMAVGMRQPPPDQSIE